MALEYHAADIFLVPNCKAGVAHRLAYNTADSLNMMRDRTSKLCSAVIVISSGIVCCMAKSNWNVLIRDQGNR
jgi:hypothetical protein